MTALQRGSWPKRLLAPRCVIRESRAGARRGASSFCGAVRAVCARVPNQALADHQDERRGISFGQRDAEVPCALHRIAALRSASVSGPDSLPANKLSSLAFTEAGVHHGLTCSIHRSRCGTAQQGEHREASVLFTRAAAAAEAASASGDGAQAAASGLMSPILLGELHASALGGAGQAAAAQKDWDTAEEVTSKVAC